MVFIGAPVHQTAQKYSTIYLRGEDSGMEVVAKVEKLFPATLKCVFSFSLHMHIISRRKT
jgi:hypothetical protein